MAAVIIMMMAATIVEKVCDTDAAFSLFYHNPVFVALWAAAATAGLVYALSRRMSRSPMTLLLHISFVVILAGAFITLCFGEKGMVHLRLDEETSTLVYESGDSRDLPFSLILEDFDIERYRGSMAASDYRSVVNVVGGPKMEISMNHIGKYHGYRFYQASYDQDLRGSRLSVSHDPWGVGVTYTGYLLLLLSMLGFFVQKDTAFRRTLRRVASSSLVLTALTLSSSDAFAAVSSDAKSSSATVASAATEASEGYHLPVLPKDIADEFGQLYVYYNDRIAPLQTLARDYCLKAYGKASYEGYSAEQVVTGWLFWYDWWNVVPFKLKAKEQGTEKEWEKEDIRMSVATGEAFRIFPYAMTDSVLWFSCEDDLPEGLEYDQWVFFRRTLDLIHDEALACNWEGVSRIISQIRKYQEKTAASVLPSDGRVKAERFYNRISRPMVPFMASITLGLILFVLAGVRISRGKKTPNVEKNALAALTMILWVYLTMVLALRWFVSGHAPFAGSYSVMLLMAWLTCIASLSLYRRFSLVQPLGFILAGFTMLVASLSSANPQITHLMPVLQSPLLSVHVLSMMISYTLFGIVALNGIMGIAVRTSDARESLRDVSLLVLYPALFLLTFGTFLGAVWANISWGSYWAWDPKETWALVTILVYSAAVHSGSLKAFRNPKFFHVFCILAFLSVLITYFGVNMILGGMHSYS